MSIGWRRLRDVAYFLTVALLVGLVVWWWPTLASLWRQQAVTFIGATLLMALAMIVQAGNYLSFLDYRAEVRVVPFVGVWGSTALLNYAGPFQPGAIARVLYLKRCGVDLQTAMFATWRQLCASCWLALGCVAVALFGSEQAGARGLALISASVFLGGWLLWMFGSRLARRIALQLGHTSKLDLLEKALSGVRWPSVLGGLIQYLFGTLVLLWVYPRFGASLGVSEAVILACIVYLSALVAVLPANLGLLEAIYALGGQSLGMDWQESAALAILLRVSHVSACVVLMPLAHGAPGPSLERG